MATIEKFDDHTEVLVLSRKEAADIAALIVGQLADVPVQGNQAGAAPVVKITNDNGQIVKQLGFLVK